MLFVTYFVIYFVTYFNNVIANDIWYTVCVDDPMYLMNTHFDCIMARGKVQKFRLYTTDTIINYLSTTRFGDIDYRRYTFLQDVLTRNVALDEDSTLKDILHEYANCDLYSIGNEIMIAQQNYADTIHFKYFTSFMLVNMLPLLIPLNHGHGNKFIYFEIGLSFEYIDDEMLSNILDFSMINIKTRIRVENSIPSLNEFENSVDGTITKFNSHDLNILVIDGDGITINSLLLQQLPLLIPDLKKIISQEGHTLYDSLTRPNTIQEQVYHISDTHDSTIRRIWSERYPSLLYEKELCLLLNDHITNLMHEVLDKFIQYNVNNKLLEFRNNIQDFTELYVETRSKLVSLIAKNSLVSTTLILTSLGVNSRGEAINILLLPDVNQLSQEELKYNAEHYEKIISLCGEAFSSPSIIKDIVSKMYLFADDIKIMNNPIAYYKTMTEGGVIQAYVISEKNVGIKYRIPNIVPFDALPDVVLDVPHNTPQLSWIDDDITHNSYSSDDLDDLNEYIHSC